MFISVLDLFKIGIGPSSSHTMGPMLAAVEFRNRLQSLTLRQGDSVRCTLRGSLAFTGKGHATDRAITLGMYGYTPKALAHEDVSQLVARLEAGAMLELENGGQLGFVPQQAIVFDRGPALPEHPNGMIFDCLDAGGEVKLSETYFSIGGGFISTRDKIDQLSAPLKMELDLAFPYPFDSAAAMLAMSADSGLSIADMKRANESVRSSRQNLDHGLDAIWQAMQVCVERGLQTRGELPGGLKIQRRASELQRQLQEAPAAATLNDWLCAYAMAVNEENADGHMVVTAPTNGAAGVVPAVLYHFMQSEGGSQEQMHEFLLVAGAIGGLIKHRSSISGAEVGCQGEVGSAAAMAAAGLCAARGGTAMQIENAAEIALEHHLGMTCDPVAGLVQVPCIERNGFGAIKAHTAAALARRGTGKHFMPLDSCIAAMKQTGMEMSEKYKETSLGGLAVSLTEC